MDDQNKASDEAQDSLESLEAPETRVENSETGSDESAGTLASAPDEVDNGLATPPSSSSGNQPKPPKKHRFHLHGANLYLAGFIVIVMVAVALAIYAFSRNNQSSSNQGQITSQNLSPQALKDLANSDVTVGGPKQVLTVQSSAVFNGQVLVKQGLQVAGSLEIGGNLSLPNIVVSGTSQFGTVQVNKDLFIAGDENLQGQLTVQNSLTVKGGGNFSGPVSAPQLTVSALNLNGDLVLTHHITAGGSTPGRSNGSALGSGGTASVSGSDTAGNIQINTGGGPPAGCFITVNFTQSYNATPHVVVTPIGSAAGGLQWYVTRNTNSFSVCTDNTPPAYSSFGFDYIIFD